MHLVMPIADISLTDLYRHIQKADLDLDGTNKRSSAFVFSTKNAVSENHLQRLQLIMLNRTLKVTRLDLPVIWLIVQSIYL